MSNLELFLRVAWKLAPMIVFVTVATFVVMKVTSGLWEGGDD